MHCLYCKTSMFSSCSALIMLLIFFGLVHTAPVAAASAAPDLTFTLLNQEPDPVEPGNYVELRFAMQNFGFGSISDVIVEILPEYPFSLDPGVSPTRDFGVVTPAYIGDEKVLLYYRLRVDEKAVEGTSDIVLRYSSNNGRTFTKFPEFPVRIRSRDSVLAVEAAGTTPSHVAPGGELRVWLSLRNIATVLLRDIRVTLGLFTDEKAAGQSTVIELPITPIGGGVEKTLDTLVPGETAEVSMDFIIDTDATTKPYKMPVTITYEDSFGQNFTKSNYIGIVVSAEPEFILNLEESEIYSNGQKGSVVVSFSNNGVSDIKFLTIALRESDDFTVLSPRKLYLGNLDSDDFETATFDLFVDTDKETVPLLFDVRFKDDYNKDYFETVMLPGIRLFDKTDAVRYGLVSAKSRIYLFVQVLIGLIFLLFLLYMAMDLYRNKMPFLKKAMWTLSFLLGVGAVLYYFFGRKRQKRMG